jgi:CMP-N,N'-diacetyllegionaminic acid synthase
VSNGRVRILGLIPARAGSKGVRGKNMRPINGKSPVERAFEVATRSGVAERIILSTDSEEIAQHGLSCGLEVPFLRPADLADDGTPMIDVAQHALHELTAEGYAPEALLLLQPTSPCRTPDHLRTAVELFADNDAVCSVVPLPKTQCPHWVMKIEDGYLFYFLPEGEKYTRRQDVPDAHRRDGTVYLTRTEVILAGSFYGQRCVPLVLDEDESFTIDTPDDWGRAEARLKQIEGG